MNEKTRGGFTRGPVQDTYGTVTNDKNRIIAEVHRSQRPILNGRERGANASLIAAAFNAATEVEDMGYNGLEAVRALPEILKRFEWCLKGEPQFDTVFAGARALIARLKGDPTNG